MVHDPAKRNEQYLRFSGQVAQFLGLFFLVVIFAGALLLLSGVLWDNLPTKHFTKVLDRRSILHIVQAVFSALFLLGVSQFIKCLIEVDFKPKWILRNGNKLIYVYVCFFLISSISSLVSTKNTLDSLGHDTSYFMVLMPMGIFAIVTMVLWIAFAFILKRILPIIQESKTRV
jgi:hypothetical protein